MTEYQFCPDFSKQNISPFKERDKNYNLQNIVKLPCEGIDQRVQIIDEIGEAQLFANNPPLPAYPQPNQDYRYKLGFLRYPEWTYDCRKSQQFGLKETEKHFDLDQISSYFTTYISLVTFFGCVFGFGFTLFYLFRKLSDLYYKSQQKVLYDTLPELQKKKPNLYEKINKNFSTELIIFIVKFLSGVSIMIILAVLFQSLNQYFQWYKSARRCTSSMMREWIEGDSGYVRNFESQQKNILLCVIMVLVLVIIDCGMFCWRNFRGDLKRQVQEEDAATNIFDEDVNQKAIGGGNRKKYGDGEQDNNQKGLVTQTIDVRSHHDNQKQNVNQLPNDDLLLGRIKRNNTQTSNQFMITQDNLLQMQNGDSSMISNTQYNYSRQKRPIRRTRMLSATQISDDGTQYWDV